MRCFERAGDRYTAGVHWRGVLPFPFGAWFGILFGALFVHHLLDGEPSRLEIRIALQALPETRERLEGR